MRRLLVLLPLPLGYGALALAWVKWWAPGAGALALTDSHVRWLGCGWLVTLCVPIVGAISGWLSQGAEQRGALALDRHHRSADRITSALAFAEIGPERRSPWMDAAIADALRTVQRPSPARAVPLHIPRSTWVSVGLALLVVGISRLSPLAGPVPAPAPVAHAISSVELSEDDLAALRQSVDELARGSESPELSSAIARFNQLVEQLAEHQLDRRELFQRLAEIERSLGAPAELEAALETGLRDIATELEKSPLARPIAEALKQHRLPDAEKALRELADRLARKDKVADSELERLRKALEQASQQSSGRLQRLEEARRNLEQEQRRLLNKKQKDGSPAAPPEAARDHKRRLDRLERERAEAAGAQQELSQLDRDLAKAAQDLMREMGKSAESLRSGAEDMNRMARKQMSERDKQELKQKLEELKELLRQGGPGREEHLRRLRQFAERARGKAGQGSGNEPPGGGNGQGGKGQKQLVLGPGGQSIPIPMPEQSPGGSGRAGSGEGAGKSEAGSKDWGSGSDPKLQGDPSDLKGKTEDVTAAAVDTGQGTSTSQVVYGAAERGFTGARYKNVYTQYRTVAEDVLEQENIPAGYEFYVRRYFQLIRPRTTP
ncbi:MAG TPA: hypothetical protein VFS67_07790 [Polyangiaceae bacterium]|nr:hypothetical protein [Polyangiaceae bacterium]